MDNKLLIDRSVAIDWENSRLEQEWHIKSEIGTPKLKSLVSRIKSRDVIITSVVTASGITFPNGEDLFKKGIISLQDNTLTIKLRKIFDLRNGEISKINFTTSLDKSIYGSMCERSINQHPVKLSNLSKFTFSIALNRADLWLTTYRSIEFRNIVIPFTIQLDEFTLENLLPMELKQKILSHANAALRSRSDSLHYIEKFNSDIFLFLQSRLNMKLNSIIKIQSSAGSVILRKSEFQIQNYPIGDGYTVSLPNAFAIEISCSLRGNEQALRGEIFFYHNEFKSFLTESLIEFANMIS